MHITITGNLGSGKSTICKILEDKYGFEIYSTGKVQRELARQMNMTTLEMNQLMCSDHKYDTMIDDETARISRENRDKNIIFDSRLAWHFVERSFKVFLSVSLDVAADRVMNDNRGKEEKYSTIEEAKNLLAARAETEDKRYKDMYNLEYFNFQNYNLVIDSTYCTPEKIASIIMAEAKKYYDTLASKGSEEVYNYHRLLISPKRLVSDVTQDDKIRLNHLITEYEKETDYKEANILVQKNGDEYIVNDGLDDVIAAFLGNVPYVPITLI